MISGTTTVIAHVGYPTAGVKSPLIYNPWLEHAAIDALVVPLRVQADHPPAVPRALFTLPTVRGAPAPLPPQAPTVPHPTTSPPLPRRAHLLPPIYPRARRRKFG